MRSATSQQSYQTVAFLSSMMWGIMMAIMTSVSVGFVDVAIHLTDFFLERIVQGLSNEAALKQSWAQGITSDKHYCAKLCTKTNSYDMCNPSQFGNDTHTFQNCLELIKNDVSSSFLAHYEQFSKYRPMMIIVFFVLMFIVFVRCLRQAVSHLYRVLRGVLHWLSTSREQIELEKSIALRKLQVEKATLDAYHKCIVDASAENKFRLPKKIN